MRTDLGSVLLLAAALTTPMPVHAAAPLLVRSNQVWVKRNWGTCEIVKIVWNQASLDVTSHCNSALVRIVGWSVFETTVPGGFHGRWAKSFGHRPWSMGRALRWVDQMVWYHTVHPAAIFEAYYSIPRVRRLLIHFGLGDWLDDAPKIPPSWTKRPSPPPANP